MKKIFTLLLMVLFIGSSVAVSKKNDEGLTPNYQITGAGTSSGNADQVIVTIVSKKKDVTDDQLGACAVHGVLFRDYDDSTNAGGMGNHAKHAIMGSPAQEQAHIDFFEPFFKNHDYKKYVQIVSDSRRVVKSGKEYKISAVVRVNTGVLKNDLKKQGLVKNLGSGW